MEVSSETAAVASQVRNALDTGDLTAFAEFLDPQVTWGAPGDLSPPCQNRRQVLDWYRQGRVDGRRARVVDVTTNADKILVSMKVTAPGAIAGAVEFGRWQVLTVSAGRVTDIRGYDNPQEALAAAGLPT